MATLNDFATVDDLENFWKDLSPEESARATDLLSLASSYLRQIAKNNDVDLDAELEDDDDGILSDSLRLVVLSAVKRAISTPTDIPPADSWSQSASPYAETMTLTNPSSDLYYKKNELALLGLMSVSGRSQIGILQGVRGGCR